MQPHYPDHSKSVSLPYALVLLAIFCCGIAALYYAGQLRDANTNIQTQLVPFSRGLVELESNLTALRVSNRALHLQADNGEANTNDIIRAHNYMAQVFSEITSLAALDLNDVQRATFFALQNAVARLKREQDEYRELLSAKRFGQAVDYYDKVLLADSEDIYQQATAFIALSKRWQAERIDALTFHYDALYWSVLLYIGLALCTSLTLYGWQRRPRWLTDIAQNS